MKFAKRSNLGSLIAAVLLGTLSLAINQVFKSNPEAVASLLRKLQPPVTRPADTRRDPSQVVAAMHTRERLLAKAYAKWTTTGVKKNAQVQGLCRATRNDLAVIGQLNQVTEEQRLQASMLALKAYFMSAELMRDEFSELFLEHSQQLAESELADAQVRKIELLRAYHLLRVKQSDAQTLLVALRDFAKTHADTKLCISLYLLVAEDLARQHKTNLARAVLSQGKETYRGSPGVKRLINRLIDLQSRDILRGTNPTPH